MITIPIPFQLRQTILAVGADLKCRPALARGGAATFFEEIGDLAVPENQEALEALVERESPEMILCDRHPGYYSTQLAERLAAQRKVPLIQVQHHRAHVAAVALEQGLFTETVVGLAFDGTGYGDDGTAWGGEFFVGSVERGFERKAHFAVLPLPGGDAAVREPWRIALSLLIERAADPAVIESWITRCRVPLRDLALFKKGLAAGIALGRSSALGRWFDAASALLGIRTIAAFEAEPAIELQKLAEKYHDLVGEESWLFQVQPGNPGQPMIIDFPGLDRIAASNGQKAPAWALAFHVAAAEATVQAAKHLAQSAGTELVVASGGCFLNGLFDRLVRERLFAAGLNYIKPQGLPPGDQAIALGQLGLVLAGLRD